MRFAWLFLAVVAASACVNSSSYGNVDLTGSVIVLSSDRAPANGNQAIQVSVALRRSSGSPVAGLSVALDAGLCNVQQADTVSDSNGVVGGVVRSGTVTRCALQVNIRQGSFAWTLPQSPALEFYALPTVATHLDFLPVPAVHAGVPFSVTVLALDAQGAADANFIGTVRLRSDDVNAMMPAPYTLVASDHGAHTFTGVWVQRAGTTLLSSTADGSGLTAAQASLTVAGGVATRLAFSNLPAQATAGSAFTAQLAALDAFGNPASNFAAQVSVASDDSGAAASTLTLDAHSVGAFTQTLLHSGVHVLSATDSSAPPLTATSTPVAVAPAAAAALALQVPAHASATLGIAVQVRAQDPYGNLDPNFASTVHMGSSDGAGTLPPDYTFTPTDAGSHLYRQRNRFGHHRQPNPHRERLRRA